MIKALFFFEKKFYLCKIKNNANETKDIIPRIRIKIAYHCK